jgi:tetratricopeptide (TPR) repeat protein
MKICCAAFVLAALMAPAAKAADPGAFLAAQFAAHRGDLTLAANDMAQALAADPANADLRQDAFVLAVLAGAPDADQLAQTLPENPLAQLLLAARAAHDGRWQAAELGFAELPRQPLADAIRPLLMAWAQEAQGLSDRAMDSLQPAIGSGHLGAIPLLHAALIADAAHRDGLAQRLYADLAHAQTQPSLQFAQILASWQARSGDMAAARATIGAAVHATPELGIAEAGLIAALRDAHAPTALHGLAQAMVDVAAASSGQDNHDVAQLLVQIARVLEPNMTDADLLASEIATGHHEMGLAAAELEKVPQNDPLEPVVQLRLAGVYAREGQLDPGASDWVLFYARGSALERAHEWPRAEADMNRALELSPDQPFVLNFLGYSMAERNQNLPLAREMIEKALHARPNDGAIVDSLGWVLLRQGETQQALRLLEKAAELQPEDPSITGHLGDAYWDAGRRVEAEDQWRRALVLRPDPDDQARIESRLKSASP